MKPTLDDAALLRRFVEEHSDAAFGNLMQKHVHLVYFAALRRVGGNTHRAQEVVQDVFMALARKSPGLLHYRSLTGWLYQATQNAALAMNRAEARRCRREHRAFMDDVQEEPSHEPDWNAVKPVVDDALAELKSRDREAVLLRFFQQRSHAEIGAALQLTENAARMCVDRALVKLREALARRGVTSTTAALGSALSASSTFAVPAGLMSGLPEAVLTGSAATVTGISLSILPALMTTTKIVVLSSAAALIVLSVAVIQHRSLAEARLESAASHARSHELQTTIDNLELRLAAANERPAGIGSSGKSEEVANDVSTLAPPSNPITRDVLDARFRRARELAKAGQHAEALQEFLWCYDIGSRQVDGYFITRYSSMLQGIADLGKDYPLALEALRQRRNAAVQRLIASETDLEAGKDVSQINRVLGEDAATHALFDSLDEDDPRRAHLVDTNISRLIEARRYRELSKAMPYDRVPQVWEEMTRIARSPAGGEAGRARRIQSAAKFAGQQIELRAGAGDTLSASDMIERALIFDNSPETVETIRRHLQRAGRPELLQYP